jgi:hypothetical protein
MFLMACTPPTTPSPPNPPPPPPPPPHSPPVITSLIASRGTLEVSESVELTAAVQDQESANDQLTFVWSAADGSFTGQGLRVTWQAPATLTTPANPVLILTVVESYKGVNAQGQTVPLEHRISRSVTVRVHNSVKELGDMGRSFLQKFATSSVSPEACVLDFSDGCSGKKAELADIQRNRVNFVILDSRLGEPRVTNLSRYTRADISMSCFFESRRVTCPPGSAGCVVGAIERVSGTCRLTAVYEQARWWLCESRFSGTSLLSPGMRLFFGSAALDAP